MEKINIMALRHSAFYSPLLTTISGGFLKAEGLEANYSVATPERTVPDAIRNGEVHLAQSAVATSFAELEQSQTIDIVHFAQINRLDGFFIAGRQPDPDFSWEQLNGKEILVDHLFQPLAMFRYALNQLGVDESCVKITDAGSVEAMDKAFRDGQGDYVHQQGPFPQQLEKEGLGHVVASVGEIVGPVAFSSLCATREWLQNDMAKAFMQAYREASRFVLETSAEEIASLEASFFPNIDREVLVQTISTYQRMGNWSPDPQIDQAAYDHLLDVYLFSGLITQRHPYENCAVLPPESGPA
ncbi:MAG: ABC transporter substrate-binding protein [Candidatus Thiodiazotropha sp. (ex Myrtea sp. 'scaly one' KF741663)]|nr:ABC transporter substrate-binding protein [Candidatus Thiodiazotropha sp. (ex Myrtea sp. 'scaly one' KF741663)]